METTADSQPQRVDVERVKQTTASQQFVGKLFNLAQIKKPVVIVAMGTVAGVGADMLLYGKPVGVSYPLAALLFFVMLVSAVLVEGRKLTWENLWFLLAALILAALSAVRAAPFVRTLNIIGSMGLGLLFVRGISGRPLSSLNFGQYLIESVQTVVVGMASSVPLFMTVAKTLRQNGLNNNPTLRRVLLGLLITLPLLTVFTGLFAAADLIFGSMVQSVLEALYIEHLLAHLMVACVLSWLFVAGITFAVTRDDDPNDTLPDNERTSHRFRFLGSIESSIVLFSMDALFALFVGVQFAALFGGRSFIEARGLTYSEYARRGFFELVTVAVLVMTLILILDFVTKRESVSAQRLFLIGCTLLVAMTVVVLASAFQRMTLYEQAFGFTQLRVYTHIFMVWLAVMLSAFLMMLYQKRSYMFATGLLIGSFAFVLSLNLINPEALIVRQNIARYQSGEDLDVRYTAELSADAVPYLIELLDDEDAADVVGPWLAYRLVRLDMRQEAYQWPSYHVSINKAYSLLEAERAHLEGYDLYQRFDRNTVIPDQN